MKHLNEDRAWMMLGNAYEEGDAHTNKKSVVYLRQDYHSPICWAVENLKENGIITKKTYHLMDDKLDKDIDNYVLQHPAVYLCPCTRKYLPVRALQCYFYAMEAQYEERILGRLRRKRKKTNF